MNGFLPAVYIAPLIWLASPNGRCMKMGCLGRSCNRLCQRSSNRVDDLAKAYPGFGCAGYKASAGAVGCQLCPNLFAGAASESASQGRAAERLQHPGDVDSLPTYCPVEGCDPAGPVAGNRGEVDYIGKQWVRGDGKDHEVV